MFISTDGRASLSAARRRQLKALLKISEIRLYFSILNLLAIYSTSKAD
jgi:hypothetical protein